MPKLKIRNTIQFHKQCWGVEAAGEDIFVKCHEYGQNDEVRVLDMSGSYKRRLGVDKDGRFTFAFPSYLKLSANATILYVSDRDKELVT